MRRGTLTVAFLVAALVCVTSYDTAGGQMLDPEVQKGIGIVEGIKEVTLKRMRSIQQGCVDKFKLNSTAHVEGLLKEYAIRLVILEGEVNKLAKEINDEARVVLLKEGSHKVQLLVYLASYATDSLIPLLRAGCFIEMKKE